MEQLIDPIPSPPQCLYTYRYRDIETILGLYYDDEAMEIFQNLGNKKFRQKGLLNLLLLSFLNSRGVVTL